MKNLAYLAGGALVGFGVAYVSLEAKFREAYKQKQEDLENTFKFVQQMRNEASTVAKVINDSYLPASDENVIKFPEMVHNEEGAIMVSPESLDTPNDYHKAISAVETPIEVFVDGGVNDYGISYIEEEEYQDDDGRLKEQILIYMDEHNPIFTMNGEPIDDWDKRIGDSILVDFYKLVPPGIDPILYVRNHRTDVDYEVVRAEP